MVDEFFPVARGPFTLNSNWTSTSAKIDGQWKVVSMHLSSNVFTNSLIAEAKEAIWWAAGWRRTRRSGAGMVDRQDASAQLRVRNSPLPPQLLQPKRNR
jgi:hypothetical protein